MEHALTHPLRTLTRWMIIAALAAAYWPFGHHAHGHAKPLAFKKALYTSGFSWKSKEYTFTIGTLSTFGTVARHPSASLKSKFAAQISHHGKIVATCERKVSGEMPFDHTSMLLRCEGALFNPASAMAKFRFGKSLEHPLLTFWHGPHGAHHELTLCGNEPRLALAQQMQLSQQANSH